MFNVQSSKGYGVTRDNRYTLHVTSSHHHIITSSNHHIISSFLLFSIFFFTLISGFAQGLKPPPDAPRFVYPTSVSLAFGMGKNYITNPLDTVRNGNVSLEIQQILAYQFNSYIFVGLGAGLDFWFYEKKTSPFIPIFANATLKWIDKKTSPFIFTNIGYAFKWQVEKKLADDIFWGSQAGILFQAGLGVNLKFSDKLSVLLSAYYKMQQSKIQYRESPGSLILAESKNYQLFHFIGIKVGVLY